MTNSVDMLKYFYLGNIHDCYCDYFFLHNLFKMRILKKNHKFVYAKSQYLITNWIEYLFP